MKKTNLLICALLLSIISVNAQWIENGDNQSNGNLSIGSTADNSYSKFTIKGPNQPTNSESKRDISFEFSYAGKSQIRAYRGDSWDTYLQFLTTPISGGNPTVKLHLNHDGKIGIGTTSPNSTLDVNGRIESGPVSIKGGIILAQKYSENDYLGNLSSNYSSGSIILGYGAAGMPNEGVSGQLVSTYDNFNGFRSALRVGPGTLEFLSSPSKLQTTVGEQINVVSRLFISNNGKVGLGTTNPDMKLTVKGNIHAEEVKIDLSVPAPDYVFKKDYNLRSIEDLEKFIKENSHLPEIPSAKDFEKNGVMLAKMNMDLLKKIEELTLYTIQQQKEIEELKTLNIKILELQEKLKELEKE